MSQETVSIILEATQKGAENYARAAASLNAVNAAVTSQSSAMAKATAAASGLGNALRIVAAASAAAIGGAVLFGKHLLDNADRLSKLARSLETTTEKLSGLMFAADLAGVSQGEMVVGLNELSKALVESKDPTSNAAQTFRALGIATKDANGNTRDAVTVFGELSDVFSTHSGSAEKAATASQLLGRSSKSMIDFLNSGSAAVRQASADLDALGGTIKTNTAKQAEDFNDNLTRLKASLTGMGMAVLEQVLPAVLDISDAFVSWIKANDLATVAGETFASTLKTVAKIGVFLGSAFRICQVVLENLIGLTVANAITQFKGLVDVLTALGKGFMDVGSSIVEVVRRFGSFGEVFRLALKGDFAGAADAAKAALVSIADAQGEVLAGVAATAEKIGGTVMATTAEVVGNITGTVSGAIDEMRAVYNEASGLMNAIDTRAEKKAAGTDASKAEKKAPRLPTAPTEKVLTFAEEMTAQLKAFGTVAHQAAAAVGRAFEGVFSSISQGLSGIIQGTMTWAGLLNNIATSVLDSVIDGIVRMFGSWITQRILLSGVNKAQAISEGATETAAKAPGAILSSISSWGVAAAVGVAAVIAAIGLAGGFQSGGYTGSGAADAPAGIVHRGEVVVPAPVVKQLGVGHFAQYFGGQMPGWSGGSYQSGGLVTLPPGSTQPQGSPAVNVSLIQVDNRQDERDAQARQSAGAVVRYLQRRGNRFKV